MRTPKGAARYRWPAAGMVLAGTAVAGEVAAQAIASAAGHHVPAQPILGGLYSPLDGLRWLGSLDGRCLVGPQLAAAFDPAHFLTRGVAHCAAPVADLAASASQAALPWAIGGGVGGAGLAIAGAPPKRGGLPKGRTFEPVLATDGKPAPLVIELGTATGKLRELGHEAGIRRGERVRLVGDDVSRNILVLGGTGSGKSTRVLNPVALQAMRQGCGLLFANVKGDVDVTVRALAKMAGREKDVRVIGIGGLRTDMLGNIPPAMSESYVAAMLLLAHKDKNSSFWNSTAADLAGAVLGILWFTRSNYSLGALHRYLRIKSYRDAINQQVSEFHKDLASVATSGTQEQQVEAKKTLSEIEAYYNRIADFYENTPDVKSNALAQLNTVLSNMIRPEIEEAFGTPGEIGDDCTRLEDLLDGAIIVINAPLQEFGVSAAAILTFFKLRFFSLMEQRRLRKEWDQTRRVGLFIDECQFVLTCAQEGMSDDRAISVIRDTGGFCVFAAQSLDAITAKLGDQVTAKALLAVMTQHILFQSKDVTTIQEALYLLGQTEVEREGTSESRKSGALAASKSVSHSTHMQAIADASLIRNLKKGQALAILAIDGEAADDVIDTTPLYVTEARA